MAEGGGYTPPKPEEGRGGLGTGETSMTPGKRGGEVVRGKRGTIGKIRKYGQKVGKKS